MINIRMNNVDTSKKLSPKITVVGVGGAGGNAVNNMIASNLIGVDFVVCNTDSQALQGSLAEHKVQLGTSLTEGLGAGAKPEIGRAAAEESLDDVMQLLDNANMTFITAGMGGGTGTGAASVIAKACRERGILTVGVVTKPFHFEGSHRMKLAEEGIAEMQSYVDTLIVIPNQNLFRVVNDKTTFSEAFKMADSVLQSAVRGVTDLIVMPGLINLDFADIRSVMQEMGKAVMGAGEATGERRATEAAEKAISNPLLDDVSMKGARGVIINVTGGYDMTLFEVDEACNRIRDEVDPEANIIFGSTFDENLEGTMRVSVVATGIEAQIEKKARPVTSGGFAVDRPVGQRLATATATTAPARRIFPATATTIATPAAAPTVPASRPYESPAAASRDYEEMASAYPQQDVAVAASAAQAAIGESAPRGSVYGGSYIPPQPVEVAAPVTGYQSAPPVQPTFRPAQAQQMPPQPQQPVYAAVEPAPASYQMPQQQPEYAAAPHPQKRRSPSLIERITGRWHGGGSTREEEDFGVQENQMAASPAPASSAGLRAAPRAAAPAPVQGRLNIDQPAAPAKQGEDELDIPAFLRRQTS
jgi:cell division protein FtsZ